MIIATLNLAKIYKGREGEEEGCVKYVRFSVQCFHLCHAIKSLWLPCKLGLSHIRFYTASVHEGAEPKMKSESVCFQNSHVTGLLWCDSEKSSEDTNH